MLCRVVPALRRLLFMIVAGGALGFCPAVATAQDHKSWTGFYAGAHAGYDWGAGHSSLSLLPDLASWVVGDPAYAQLHGRYDKSPDGFLGGAQLGFNWQSGSIVVGIETDLARLNVSSTSQRQATILGSLVGTSLKQELDWLGTVRGRIGILPTGSANVLVYLTGGLAYGRVSTSHYFMDLTQNSGFVGSSSDWDVGGVVGGGVEWALRDGISLKAEYLYYDLGGRTVGAAHFQNPAPPQYGANAHYDTQGHILRVGVNYKLSGL